MIQAEEHRQIIAEIARQEEVLAYKLVAGLAHALPFVGVPQEIVDTIGGPGRGMNQESRVIVVDLQRNAPASPADHRLAEYLEAGKEQRVHEGYLASRRCPWYSQEKREPAPFVCTYMGRSLERPFRFIWNRSRATAANVYLLLYPKPRVAGNLAERAEEVFEALRAIRPEHFFNKGRVYGGGLHKMEPAELMRLPADALARILGAKVERQQTFL